MVKQKNIRFCSICDKPLGYRQKKYCTICKPIGDAQVRKISCKRYKQNNREKVNAQARKDCKNARLRNPDKIKARKKASYERNKDKNREKNKAKSKIRNRTEGSRLSKKKWREKNPNYMREYKKRNEEHISIIDKNRKKIRKQEDIQYKLRCYISTAIYIGLKKQNGSKHRKSCFKHLPYSLDELEIYLQNLFEPWMTWENWGKYSIKTWNDNDPSTWKWNIDHIIPKSDLPHETMEEENYQKCWALENLRPYSAKQNVLDGAQRARHKKKDNK